MEKFIFRHRINIAKLFLGHNGGYTLRQYKKIFLREIRRKKNVADAKRARWEARKAREAGHELQAEVQASTQEDQGPDLNDTDLSDLEDDWYNMDDESF